MQPQVDQMNREDGRIRNDLKPFKLNSYGHGPSLSDRTIRLILIHNGLYERRPRRDPLLTGKHKNDKFAKIHVDKPQSFWEIIF